MKQIQLPGGGLGAAFDGSHVWYTLGFTFADTNLYRLDPTATNPLATVQAFDMVALTGGRNIVPGGLAWDSTRNHLWVATFIDFDNPGNLGGGNGDIFEVDPVGQSVVSFFPTLSFTQGELFQGGVIDGLAYDSVTDTLWFSEDQAVIIHQTTTTGVPVSSFTLPLDSRQWDAGLTFDGSDLWLAIRTGGARGTLPGFVQPTFYEFSKEGTFLSLFQQSLGPRGAEDIAFDPITFAPKCAIWLASHNPNELTAFEAPCQVADFLVIDEDSIDNGSPPNFFEDVDVNDPIADIGVRAQLPFFQANVGRKIVLHSGEVGDEGLFAVKRIPASWDAAGPTSDGLRNYLAAGPGLGTPDGNGDRESLLDKVTNVTPLRATALKGLEGRTVCAVVYDSDISINYDPLDGSLKGANLGTVAFRVISVTDRTDSSSSALPKLAIEILHADTVCGGPLRIFDEAPPPLSSSEPFDVSVKEESP